MTHIRIGHLTIEMSRAAQLVADYTDPTKSKTKKPYAYRAYDFLDTGSPDNELNDGDLLAPALLNSTPSVSAFYRLRAIKGDLQNALKPDIPLATLSDTDIADRLGPLYSVLDDDLKKHRGYGLGGTTLSKVLHRKRPESLCLHDKWVRMAYLGTESVPKVKKRSWAMYMTLLSQAMAHDLQSQTALFADLHESVHGEAVADLRLLDILAWSSRGGTAQ